MPEIFLIRQESSKNKGKMRMRNFWGNVKSDKYWKIEQLYFTKNKMIIEKNYIKIIYFKERKKSSK
ncbi:hypothetical protein D7Y05_04590 [bacterium 1XD42-54]|nr:hypothetical protein D7Y05_04590 [bacterium 1XD42-54]